jgi:hypothetical protein
LSARTWGASIGLILATSSVARAEPDPENNAAAELQGATRGSESSQRHRPWRKGRALPGTESASAPAEPEPPPPPPATRQGFFSRFALGVGVFTAATGDPEDSRSYVGLPLSLEVYFGGTLAPTLSLGAGYLRDEIFGLSSSDAVRDGDEPELDDVSFCLEALSLLMQAYPNPRSPFYGTLTLGFGRLYARRPDDPIRPPLFLPVPQVFADPSPEGVVFSLGAGYDTWLDAEWAMSLSARVLVAPMGVSENGQDLGMTVVTPSVLIGLAYQ